MQGSCDALSEIINHLRDRGQATKYVSWDEFNQLCSTLLVREENPPGAAGMSGVASHNSEAPSSPRRGEKGWEDVDSMYTDPEFKTGCLLFTQFFKGEENFYGCSYVERSKEIRLAYVCGFRNALLEALEWVSKIHQMDLTRGNFLLNVFCFPKFGLEIKTVLTSSVLRSNACRLCCANSKNC